MMVFSLSMSKSPRWDQYPLWFAPLCSCQRKLSMHMLRRWLGDATLLKPCYFSTSTNMEIPLSHLECPGSGIRSWCVAFMDLVGATWLSSSPSCWKWPWRFRKNNYRWCHEDKNRLWLCHHQQSGKVSARYTSKLKASEIPGYAALLAEMRREPFRL